MIRRPIINTDLRSRGWSSIKKDFEGAHKKSNWRPWSKKSITKLMHFPSTGMCIELGLPEVFTETKRSRACAAMSRTTSLSYGNVRYSGTRRTKTSTDYYEIMHIWLRWRDTKYAQNGYNRLAWGGSPDRWKISIYTSPYLTFSFLVWS
jgi:hypothetical protein